nr:MAG TPA: hypothetical protein [Caudoviricetes sp.]
MCALYAFILANNSTLYIVPITLLSRTQLQYIVLSSAPVPPMQAGIYIALGSIMAGPWVCTVVSARLNAINLFINHQILYHCLCNIYNILQ